MTQPIRVAVADDHQLFREGVIEILGTYPDILVVGEASDAASAIEVARNERPDVVLLDLDMPDTIAAGEASGATASAIRSASPRTRIVILTMHDSAQLVRQLVRSGASGYLLKSASRDELHSAITTAASAGDAVTVTVSRATAGALSAGAPDDAVLTPRELDVLRALTGGATNHAIGRQLHLAEATVKRHLATIYTKLEAHSRLQAVDKARALGLLPPR